MREKGVASKNPIREHPKEDNISSGCIEALDQKLGKPNPEISAKAREAFLVQQGDGGLVHSAQSNGTEQKQGDSQRLYPAVGKRGAAAKKTPAHPESDEGQGMGAYPQAQQEAIGKVRAHCSYPVPGTDFGSIEKGSIISMKGDEAEQNQQGEHQEKNGPDFVLLSLHKNPSQWLVASD